MSKMTQNLTTFPPRAFLRYLYGWQSYVSRILILFVMTCASLNARSYETSFPLAENPISENGNWVNGQAQGLDWSDVSTKPGFARGEQVPDTGNYNDSVA